MKVNVYFGSLGFLVSGKDGKQDQIVDFSLTPRSKPSNSCRSCAADQPLFPLVIAVLKVTREAQICNNPECTPFGAQMSFRFCFCPLLSKTDLETKESRLRKRSPLILIRIMQSPDDQSPDYIGLERTIETLIWNMKKKITGKRSGETKLEGPGPSFCQFLH